MASTTKAITKKHWPAIDIHQVRGINTSLAAKLILGFLMIIVFISAVFMFVGVRLISNRIFAEAQEKVRNDLNAAREIYLSQLTHIDDVVRYTANRFFLRDAILSNDLDFALEELSKIKIAENLDILAVTDRYGYVLIRSCNPGFNGDSQGHDEIVHRVLYSQKPAAATIIVSGDDLIKDTPALAEQAHIDFIDTPLARPTEKTDTTDGMMLKAAAPIFDQHNNLIGVVYSAVLLNKNYKIVDKVKQTVYENVIYKGQDIGTATIFMDDIRISTNVKNEDGSRAIGTRVSEEVYNQVVIQGEPWIDRAYVVNNWYITAYEPIRDVYDRIIGILYVGVLEQKYKDIQNEMVFTFLVISILGALISLTASYFIARRILVPINRLVSASKDLAKGNLDAQVTISTNDELEYLADSFNAMAQAVKRRDEKLREFATQRIMESERLALIGQLSANVAHELNNPLQGIVTYSHLLLEDEESRTTTKASIEKIVGQANRCRDIVRGLLDFSRQRKPDKTLSDLNVVLNDCASLLENQALFHNIRITKNFQANLPQVVCDPSQIERVFINLIINAAEAMDDNGQITLQTEYAAEDDFVEIVIADTGNGISPEDLDKIFDPFFTTKDVGHGTGLGLAISYGIIKAHRGSISVDSELGKGTSFTIRLPLRAPLNGTDDEQET